MRVVFHYVEKLRSTKNKVVFYIAEISILKKINDVVFYLKMEWTKNMEDYLKNFEMEDDLKNFENGRWP